MHLKNLRLKMVFSRRKICIWSLSPSECTHYCSMCWIPIPVEINSSASGLDYAVEEQSLQLLHLRLGGCGLSPKSPVWCVNVS